MEYAVVFYFDEIMEEKINLLIKKTSHRGTEFTKYTELKSENLIISSRFRAK